MHSQYRETFSDVYVNLRRQKKPMQFSKPHLFSIYELDVLDLHLFLKADDILKFL